MKWNTKKQLKIAMVSGIDFSKSYRQQTKKLKIDPRHYHKLYHRAKKIASVSGFDDDYSFYVGTYAKYNNGSLDGAWVNVDDFDTYEDFVEYCYKLHSDEIDPEFMIQDINNVPKSMYHEAGLPTEEEFNILKAISDSGNKEAVEAFIDYYGSTSLDEFEDHYQGEFASELDFAYEYIESTYGDLHDIMGDLANYFDYDAYARDLFLDAFTFHNGFVFYM